MASKKKTGAKGKKIGRAARKLSHTKYNSTERWEENKRRKQIRHQKRMDMKKLKRLERLQHDHGQITD